MEPSEWKRERGFDFKFPNEGIELIRVLCLGVDLWKFAGALCASLNRIRRSQSNGFCCFDLPIASAVKRIARCWHRQEWTRLKDGTEFNLPKARTAASEPVFSLFENPVKDERIVLFERTAIKSTGPDTVEVLLIPLAFIREAFLCLRRSISLQIGSLLCFILCLTSRHRVSFPSTFFQPFNHFQSRVCRNSGQIPERCPHAVAPSEAHFVAPAIAIRPQPAL
jgi:hypothetical protein